MKSVNPNKPVSFMYILLILVGVYYAFLPNRSTNSSVFDFFTSEKVSDSDAFDLESFSKIPVLRGGRVKPIDSVARNTLLVMRNKRTALRVLSAEENSEFERISDLIKDDGIESLTPAEVDFHDYFSRRKMIMITHNGLPHKAAEISAIEWFSKVLFKPEESDELKTFLIDHDQVLGLMNKKMAQDGKFFSYSELEPYLENIEKSYKKAASKERELRDSFDRNILDLYRSLLLYRKLKVTISPPVPTLSPEMSKQLQINEILFNPEQDKDLTAEYSRFRKLTEELSSNPEKIKIGSPEFARGVFMLDRYSEMNIWAEFFPIPPEKDDPKKQWRTIGESLVGKEPLDSKEKQKMDYTLFTNMVRQLVSMDANALKSEISSILINQKMNPTALFATQFAEAIKLRREIDPVLDLYENLKTSYSLNDHSTFNDTVMQLRKIGEQRAGEDASTLLFEKTYNGFEPFYRSSVAYIIIFLIAGTSWLFATFSSSDDRANKSGEIAHHLRNIAYILTGLVLVSHTFGLLGRMYIEGRPPVTNLYSSALFIGWGAVLLCFLTEKYLRLGVASAMGALIGFGSLVIAHNLSLDSSLNPSGDTMEMMRAVLDSNFWLATHVVIITIGYSTTFLAGFLGIAFVVYRIFTFASPANSNIGIKFRSVEKDANKILGSMIYGITCFSLFFSLVGTVLGGIWADQSWGRFWGWDAKENGALLIVIWNAILLHARWSGIAKTRGIAAIAIFGNVVTAWSWFGTNLLGVGLHSYGFMENSFKPLMYFVLSQLILIAVPYSIKPLQLFWGSFYKASSRANH